MSTFQEIECENNEDASAKSPWKTEWHNLWIELKSWRSYWQKDEKDDFLENFGPAALYFASSTYDVTSDSLVADSYIGKSIVLCFNYHTVMKKKLGLEQFQWIRTIFMFLDPN